MSEMVDVHRTLEGRSSMIAERAMETYRVREERSALRCALGDATAICDILTKIIEDEHRVRGKRISKRGQEMAAVAKRCGDAIWATRELIHFESAHNG